MKIYLKFLIIGFILNSLFCSDYNPFENSANVDMVVIESNSTLLSDTIINIFSTKTLQMTASVRENIDSFSLKSENNRFFSDTTVNSPLLAGGYTFLFSFIDTGTSIVTLTTYRKDGDDIKQEFTTNVKSPLYQDTVTIQENEKSILRTVPVSDNVTYFWSFGEGIAGKNIVEYPSDSLSREIVDFDPLIDTGELWIEDSLGNQSQKVTFNYRYIDTIGPAILSLNDGYVDTDTIITGQESFILKISCNDLTGIGGASVNNVVFANSSYKSFTESIYYQTFSSMDTVLGYLNASITAWDKNNNSATKVFYIRYDVNGPKELFQRISPPVQPYSTGVSDFDIIMDVSNVIDDTITISVKLIEADSTINLDTLPVSDTAVSLSYNATLSIGTNTFIYTAFETDSVANILARDTVVINYSTENIDKTAPYINKITVNGIEGDKHYISDNFAYLELSALDENMDSVLINGELKTEFSPYLWKDTLAVFGTARAFIIRLVDKSGNETRDTVLVAQNNIPQIDPPVNAPSTFVIGKAWYDTITVSDKDGDQIELTNKLNPINDSIVLRIIQKSKEMPVKYSKLSPNHWQVAWNGLAINDTLKDKLISTDVILDDKKQTNIYNWQYKIVDSSDANAYDLSLTYSDSIYVTESGFISLVKVQGDATISGKITGDAMSFTSEDTVAIIFKEQTVKYNSTNGDFNIIISGIDKSKITENAIVAVIDKNGLTTIVDTLKFLYSVKIPYKYENDIKFNLLSSNGVSLDSSNHRVVSWSDSIYSNISLVNNIYPVNDSASILSTKPIYLKNGIAGKPEIVFLQKDGIRSCLLNTEMKFYDFPFTVFVVAKNNSTVNTPSEQILFSQSSSYEYLGFGLKNGHVSLLSSDSTTLLQDNSTGAGSSVIDSEWHIYCFRSENGLEPDDSGVVDEFDMIQVDAYDRISSRDIKIRNLKLSGLSTEFPYFILGAGGKHNVEKPWSGNIVDFTFFDRAFDKSEITEMMTILSLKYGME